MGLDNQANRPVGMNEGVGDNLAGQQLSLVGKIGQAPSGHGGSHKTPGVPHCDRILLAFQLCRVKHPNYQYPIRPPVTLSVPGLGVS